MFTKVQLFTTMTVCRLSARGIVESIVCLNVNCCCVICDNVSHTSTPHTEAHRECVTVLISLFMSSALTASSVNYADFHGMSCPFLFGCVKYKCVALNVTLKTLRAHSVCYHSLWREKGGVQSPHG